MYKFVENQDNFLSIQLEDDSPYPGVIFTIDFSTTTIIDEPKSEDGSARVQFEYNVLDKSGLEFDDKSEAFCEVVGKVFLDILQKSLEEHQKQLAEETGVVIDYIEE